MMKKITILAAIAALLAWPLDTSAQGFFKKLKDKAVQRVQETVEGQVDRAVSGDDTTPDEQQPPSEDAPQGTPVQRPQGQQASYTQGDFVPGATPFFVDDVANERVGEFPSKWDFVTGEECQVATINGQKAIHLGGWVSEIQPLMKNMDSYLPEEFTVEFDIWSHPTGGDNANNRFSVHFSDNENVVFFVEFAPDACAGNSWLNFSYTAPNGDPRDGSNNGKIHQYIQPNTWTRVQFSFNKRAMKVYLNGNRVVNLPNVKQPLKLKLNSTTSAKDDDGLDRFFLRNFRFAKGAVALYDRQVSDVERAIQETGKFVTNNILFETGKAVLKPESMAEIQKVADYMKKNPSVRFEVQGHTDNQGSDKVNDPLSQQRAEAVVKALEGLGVDAFNLRAVGKGSHEPVADNKTEAGRAKNRRVEFIKK